MAESSKMSFTQRAMESVRKRAAEVKGKLADRQRKGGLLPEEDERLEHEVFAVRDAYATALKRGQECHMTDDRKIPVYGYGTRMKKAAEALDQTSPFFDMYNKVAGVQEMLGLLTGDHHRKLHEQIYSTIDQTLREEYPPLSAHRRKLQKAHSDSESIRSKLDSLRRQNKEVNRPKVDALESDLHDAERALASQRAKYVEALVEVSAHERDFAIPLVNMILQQLEFHRTAVSMIESMLPKLQELQQQVGSNKAFGQPLPETGVDPIVGALAAVVNRDGLQREGIFRLAGSTINIRKLRGHLNAGRIDLDSPAGYENDVFAIASMLKEYLRAMPDALLSSDLYDAWINTMRCSQAERLLIAEKLLQRLPPRNLTTLKFLCRFLAHVSQYSAINKMEAKNLGIVFGPNVLFPADARLDTMAGVKDSAAQSGVIEFLIQHHLELFGTAPGELDPTLTDPKLVPGAEAILIQLQKPKPPKPGRPGTMWTPASGQAGPMPEDAKGFEAYLPPEDTSPSSSPNGSEGSLGRNKLFGSLRTHSTPATGPKPPSALRKPALRPMSGGKGDSPAGDQDDDAPGGRSTWYAADVDMTPEERVQHSSSALAAAQALQTQADADIDENEDDDEDFYDSEDTDSNSPNDHGLTEQGESDVGRIPPGRPNRPPPATDSGPKAGRSAPKPPARPPPLTDSNGQGNDGATLDSNLTTGPRPPAPVSAKPTRPPPALKPKPKLSPDVD